nr:hypothetical protein [Tanacetum cinerariifolium]
MNLQPFRLDIDDLDHQCFCRGKLSLLIITKAPQDFATTIAEVEEAPNATQARIAKENVKTDCSKEEGIASDETARQLKRLKELVAHTKEKNIELVYRFINNMIDRNLFL